MEALTGKSPAWAGGVVRQIKKVKPLGRLSPYSWAIEPTHGCNLRCGHCSCRLLTPGKYTFMSEKTWRALWEIIRAVTPTCRVDLCLAGEPTLHPKLVEFLRIARATSPCSQIQITTNGTNLLAGKVNYRELIEAGANIIYTDMYGPRERFQKMAEDAGYPWYFYYDKPEDAPGPWTYYGPHLQMVVLQEQPENWPVSRYRAGLMGTWYNHLDWEAAKKFGLAPVVTPPTRRCNQPFTIVPVSAQGDILLCCQDNWHESAGEFGSVHDGVDGFYANWFGQRYQTIRRRLRQKDRAATKYCRRCCITFSRCDYIHWEDEDVSRWYNGKKWVKLPASREDPK